MSSSLGSSSSQLFIFVIIINISFVIIFINLQHRYLTSQPFIHLVLFAIFFQARDIQEFIPLINQIIARFKVSLKKKNLFLKIIQ